MKHESTHLVFTTNWTKYAYKQGINTEHSLQVSDETRDNTHWRKVQGSKVQILWQNGEQPFCNYGPSFRMKLEIWIRLLNNIPSSEMK